MTGFIGLVNVPLGDRRGEEAASIDSRLPNPLETNCSLWLGKFCAQA
jgi:hypothetical protein